MSKTNGSDNTDNIGNGAGNTNSADNTGNGADNEAGKPKPKSSHPMNFGIDDKTLQEELSAYQKALQEEYAIKSNSGDPTAVLGGSCMDPSANVEKYTRDFFRKNLAHAAAQVVWLSSNSTSDAVRLNACKIIIKEALEDCRAEGDPIKELMAALQVD